MQFKFFSRLFISFIINTRINILVHPNAPYLITSTGVLFAPESIFMMCLYHLIALFLAILNINFIVSIDSVFI